MSLMSQVSSPLPLFAGYRRPPLLFYIPLPDRTYPSPAHPAIPPLRRPGSAVSHKPASCYPTSDLPSIPPHSPHHLPAV
ncbi:hypothetical protein BV20DRAFT_811944 [Pilatotrama ljubarskyi]|nr:hypothetical protein BV20DRAFT_811944 [Pilatotrama ljubarskyi]